MIRSQQKRYRSIYTSSQEMDVETWKRHLTLMAEGKLRPNHEGLFLVDRVQTGRGSKEPKINFVTPIAQDIEMAKSELKNGSIGARKGYKSADAKANKRKITSAKGTSKLMRYDKDVFKQAR